MLAGAAVDQGNTSGSADDSVQLKELMVLVPKLVTRINSLEKELKDTKQTLGKAVLKLVKKVKTLETALKRKSKKVLIAELEGEESEDQWEAQEEEISPTILEAAKTLSKVASQGVSKEKSTDKWQGENRRRASKRGQEKGKAPIVEEVIQAITITKEQLRQEEAGLERGFNVYKINWMKKLQSRFF
ncbi:hypothetical protein Tco_0603566 [Tanacetum coccineum]